MVVSFHRTIFEDKSVKGKRMLIKMLHFELFQTSMPVRTTAIHVVNNNWAFDMIWQIFKQVLSDRMRERVFIHGNDMESLHKHIDKANLPIKYGGEMPEYPYTAWMKNLAKNEKVMDELRQLGYGFDPEDVQAVI